MKEATGELSGTVITVVAIAAVAAIFTAIILPVIRNNIKQKTYCSSATCTGCDGKTCTCSYVDEKGEPRDDLKCPDPSAQ